MSLSNDERLAFSRDLIRTSQAVRDAEVALRQAMSDRDERIVSAVNSGLALRTVGEMAGLSAAQVLNITRGHRGGS